MLRPLHGSLIAIVIIEPVAAAAGIVNAGDRHRGAGGRAAMRGGFDVDPMPANGKRNRTAGVSGRAEDHQHRKKTKSFHLALPDRAGKASPENTLIDVTRVTPPPVTHVTERAL